MSAPAKERQDARVPVGDNTPTTHIASPHDDSVALCGTRRPEHIGTYMGKISRSPVPCVVCLDVQDEARSARGKGEA